jgi:hypothetical protein
VKERYQDIDDRNEELKDFLASHKAAKDFLDRYEMSWIYHDSALKASSTRRRSWQPR